MVYSPNTYCVSQVYHLLLYPGCHHPPSLLLAQEGWNTVVDTHGVSAWSKVETVACGRAGTVGPGLREHSLIPHSFPHYHYSSHSAGNHMGDPCDVGSMSVTVTICSIFTALHWNSTRACNICCLCTLFSFNNIKLNIFSISYPEDLLPGVVLLYGV